MLATNLTIKCPFRIVLVAVVRVVSTENSGRRVQIYRHIAATLSHGCACWTAATVWLTRGKRTASEDRNGGRRIERTHSARRGVPPHSPAHPLSSSPSVSLPARRTRACSSQTQSGSNLCSDGTARRDPRRTSESGSSLHRGCSSCADGPVRRNVLY